MKTIIEIIASIVVLYLTMCLIALKWTPMWNRYVSSAIDERVAIVIYILAIVFVIYLVIQLIKTIL